MRKDQYQAMLQLDQVVWTVVTSGTERGNPCHIRSGQTETGSGHVCHQANGKPTFFGILLLKEQLKQNQLMQEELQRNYDNVTAYVKNGIANQADLDAVKVEQLNNIQQRHTLEATYHAYSEMLKIMINHPTPLTGNTLKNQM